MNPLTKKIIPHTRLLYQVRNAGSYWNKDWLPGPYPQTEEERAAAAKKYNLLPEEYKPLDPSQGFDSYGDYPEVPDISECNRDVYYPWDFPEMRRNYGEAMHKDTIYYTGDRVDTLVHKNLRYPVWKMFLALAGFTAFVAILPLTPLEMHPPVARRQMPKPGVVHYTYEPVD